MIDDEIKPLSAHVLRLRVPARDIPEFCGCRETDGCAMPRYHDCAYVQARNTHINDAFKTATRQCGGSDTDPRHTRLFAAEMDRLSQPLLRGPVISNIINLPVVPVLANEAESNHATRDHSPIVNDSIGSEAQESTTEKPLPGLLGPDSCGDGQNLSAPSWDRI